MPRPLRSVTILLLAATPAIAASQRFALDRPDGLVLHNVVARSSSLEGKAALEVTSTPEAAASAGGGGTEPLETLAIVPGVELADGTIEVDLAGAPAANAAGGARGFVGVAFRMQPDRRTYDAFYLRPTNGRAEDQERRNHSAQYISHPDWPWYRLRQETPSRYESYVDIQPDKWIHVRIEIAGEQARLYVDGAEQPTLIVNDLKSGSGRKGQVALWTNASTVAHFANLVVTPR